MNSQWGLTELGFRRPSYEELLDGYEVSAKERFGQNINLGSRSILGLFLRLFAWVASHVWQQIEKVYNSAFVDGATGISLLRLGALIGISRLPAQKAVGTLTITGDPGANVYTGFIASANNTQRFVTMEDAEIGEDGFVTVPIQAYVAGPDGNVAAGTIATIVTPQAAVLSVINEDDTIGGRERETEAEFRARYIRSTDIAGGSNTDAIRAELLRTEAVAAAYVAENVTDETDADGLPPHSIECVVYGGVNLTVATAIHRRKGAGINTFGTETVTITDASGRAKEIHFSRPTPRPIWVRVTGLVTGDRFPLDGEEQIAAKLVAHIGDEGASSALTGGLSIGEPVIYNRLISPVNEVFGVVDFTLEISEDGEEWVKSNITIGPRDKAVTSTARVVVSR